MIDSLSNLEGMVAASVANEQTPTGESIRELIASLRQLPMFATITDEDAEKLAKRMEERVTVTQQIGSVLTERDHQPWLDAARARIEPILLGPLQAAPNPREFSRRRNHHT